MIELAPSEQESEHARPGDMSGMITEENKNPDDFEADEPEETEKMSPAEDERSSERRERNQ